MCLAPHGQWNWITTLIRQVNVLKFCCCVSQKWLKTCHAWFLPLRKFTCYLPFGVLGAFCEGANVLSHNIVNGGTCYETLQVSKDVTDAPKSVENTTTVHNLLS